MKSIKKYYSFYLTSLNIILMYNKQIWNAQLMDFSNPT
jgi:hypothetical protein